LEWFKKSFSYTVDEIDQLTQTINEQASEQRKAMNAFSKAMNNFATERSLETCLEALNTSIQIANIRGKLVESYEYYARLLEKEITRINNAHDVNYAR
jgi:hypothetical protein